MKRRLYVTAAAVAAGAGLLTTAVFLARPTAQPLPTFDLLDEPGARGRLVVSVHGAHASSAAGAPVAHVTTVVSGRGYGAMEDNDLRGYLDGRFQFGWNQPGQIHVRVGRKEDGERYGERELFRVLQRWAEVPVPPGARVTAAAVSLGVEHPSAQPIRLVLYDVARDWNPGSGGTLSNNNSPPNAGEVWWNDRSFGSAPWGLPGAGYAARGVPDADTDAMPLADALYRPGGTRLAFESTGLTRYVGDRVRAGAPLLFLLKVSDLQEDVPGSRLFLYSANHGDDRNVGRRPRLRIEWEARADAMLVEDVFLEYGRAYALPRLRVTPGSWIAASFSAEPGYDRATVQVRDAAAGATSAWLPLAVPLQVDWEWAELRVVAATDPIGLGQAFTAGLRDTWVLTAAPEEQQVSWRFVSPTGRVHEVEARYLGEFRWTVTFTPDELGPWTYSWSQQFMREPYRSEEGRFDVVAGEREALLARLDTLIGEVESRSLRANTPEGLRAMVNFTRIERALLSLETPRTFHGSAGDSLRDALDRARAALSGAVVPDRIPLVPHEPHAWQRADGAERR